MAELYCHKTTTPFRCGDGVPSIQEAANESRTVRVATDDDVPAMAGVLARAFRQDPAFTWVLRGDPSRLVILERGFELLLREVWMKHRATYTTAQIAAVSVWEPPQTWKLSILDQVRLLPATSRAFGRHVLRLLRALTVLEAKHPREPPTTICPSSASTPGGKAAAWACRS